MAHGRVLLVVLALLGILVPSTPLMAGSKACGSRVNNTVAKLLQCVTVDGVRQHQAAFQDHADANDGTRVSGFGGYNASVDYVVGLMEGAGYQVTVQPFDFTAFFKLGPSALEQTAPGAVVYVEGVDFQLADQTDPGDVTAQVTAVDLQLGLGNTSTSGCEALDFAAFPAGNIALIQRGTCTFRVKAENAAAAGAVGVIIFNQGNTAAADRQNLFGGTLSSDYAGGIPVLLISYPLGAALSAVPGLAMHMLADTLREVVTTYNVLAETPGGRADNVVMVGAHLDSVPAGPGINDNGSGSAAILEVALQMHKVKPRNKVRFAWWGAEESALVGSTFYVDSLSDEERARIALYLNFDMVGSPNFVRFIFDGDGSAVGVPGPPGSGAIEKFFEDFYTARGLAFEPTPLDNRSDYAAFSAAGIPVGGLFSGAEGIKTAAQQAIYGGTVGTPYDPCYHQACDTFDNVSLDVLDLNADAIAQAVLQYAMNTQTVNGQKGKGNFKKSPGALPSPERLGHLFIR